MKSILIPTNFSDVARHATDYAVGLFGEGLERIILLNSFEQPKTGRAFQVSLVDIMEKTSKKGLKEDELRIKENFPNLKCKIELIPTQGDLSSSIKSIVKNDTIDLIVMGSKGDQELVDMIIESVTARVISSIDHPMLIVPPIAEVRPLRKIVFASDLKAISEASVLKQLLKMSRENNSTIEVLNITKTDVHENEKMEKMMDTLLEEVPHNYSYRRNSNIHTGIYKFLKEVDAELLTLVKRKGQGSLVARLFHKSISRRIAKNVDQTLLLLTDQDAPVL